MNMPKITRTAVSTIGVAAFLTAGAAQAAELHSWSKDGGAHAYSGSARGAVGIADTKGDDNYVFANYYRSGDSSIRRLENGNGVGTSVTGPVDYTHRVTTLRACTNYSWSPDDCDAWR